MKTTASNFALTLILMHVVTLLYRLLIIASASLCPSQWRSKGEQVEARALGHRLWRRNSTLFAVILNVFLSKNLDRSMLKNAYFMGKKM